MLIEEVKLIEQNIELPFFAHVEGDDEETFIKIDENTFSKIKIENFGMGVELSIHNRKPVVLTSIWFQNKCEASEWDLALKQAKEYLSHFTPSVSE